MDQSSTLDRKLDQASIKDAIDKTIQYINSWKINQIREIITADTDKLVCIKINENKFFVGKYMIMNMQGSWAAFKLYADEPDSYFSSKRSAVSYAVCIQQGRIKLSDKIIRYDSDLMLHKSNLVEYTYNFNQAVKNNDNFKIGFYTTMIDEAEKRINNAKSILQKSLNLAKYFNNWE